MTAPSTATRLVARTPVDLVAMVPVVLGFVPQDSVALLTFGGTQTFHARLDLPPPDDPEAVQESVASLLQPSLRHGVRRVVLVAFAEDTRGAGVVGHALVEAFEGSGIEVVQALRADGRRCFPLVPGRAGVPWTGAPYELTSHRFTAQAVLDGRVTHDSRDALAATLVRDEARAAALTEALADAATCDDGEPWRSASWAAEVVAGHARRGSVPGDAEAARLLTAVREVAARDAALFLVGRHDAADHVALWTDLVRRSPDDLLAAPAVLLGFSAWIAGHGALAWCAVDVCRRCRAGAPDGGHAGRAARRGGAAVGVGAGPGGPGLAIAPKMRHGRADRGCRGGAAARRSRHRAREPALGRGPRRAPPAVRRAPGPGEPRAGQGAVPAPARDPDRPVTDLASVEEQLLVARAVAGRAARGLGLAAAAAATAPLADELRLTPDDRYRDMVAALRRDRPLGRHLWHARPRRVRGGRRGSASSTGSARGCRCCERQRQLALLRGPRHRLRLLAVPALVAVAQRRPDRALRLRSGPTTS